MEEAQLLELAYQALNKGARAEAVQYFVEAIKVNPRRLSTWLDLEKIIDDPKKKKQCLIYVLNADPGNVAALERMRLLDQVNARVEMPRASVENRPSVSEINRVAGYETTRPAGMPPLAIQPTVAMNVRPSNQVNIPIAPQDNRINFFPGEENAVYQMIDLSYAPASTHRVDIEAQYQKKEKAYKRDSAFKNCLAIAMVICLIIFIVAYLASILSG